MTRYGFNDRTLPHFTKARLRSFSEVFSEKNHMYVFCWMSIGVKDVTVTIPILGGDFNKLFFCF